MFETAAILKSVKFYGSARKKVWKALIQAITPLSHRTTVINQNAFEYAYRQHDLAYCNFHVCRAGMQTFSEIQGITKFHPTRIWFKNIFTIKILTR